eukprot:Phypoly_transcript_02333.p1 GENE.Phypoly_transcript_02333~~Phypoly_transcript_02333.p1  ORF type:complete len:636 (-),score=119.63 Phypoly_transcript_02333:880-2787(-)
MATSFSVKEKQIEGVVRMLNFNVPAEQHSSHHWQEVWKVLVFDKYCSDVISLLLKKGDLRNQGITLHLLLHSDRQAIPDVPAIYFVTPNKDNIRRICEDCRYHLYDSFYINFSSSISRPLLEEFASSTVQSESSQLVSKVFDQYLNFLSLEKDLFCFNTPSSYIAFNDPTLSDSQAEANVEAVVESLLSVLVTMGVVPIIRAPKNSAAEQIARELDARLHQHLTSASTSFNSDPITTSSHYRPLLVILDRNIDLTVMLNHSWTYQALVHDLLNMQLNRVTVQVQEGEKTLAKTYDLDQDIDSFWSDNIATPFHNVGGAVKEQFNKYTESVEQLNKLKKIEMESSDATEDEKVNLLNSKTKGLSQIVSNIPELQEKNAIIERHSNIATAIMKHVKEREIDAYFEQEEAIITKSLSAPKELINLICNEGRGTPEDKVRLFLIYFLSTKSIPPAEMEQMEEALTKMGADLGPLKHLKKTKAFNEGLLATLNAVPSTTRGSSFVDRIAGTIAQGTGYEAVDRLSSMFSTSVRSLLPKSKDLYVSRVVGSLMEMKNALNVEDTYLYFDPKAQSRGGNIPRKNTPFNQAIVFTVGGGNYVEYQNLMDYAKKMQPAKKIIYGTTEMLTPRDFLQQLSTISKK